MDFNGISELDEDGIIQMYNDIIIESGGDELIAGCCCTNYRSSASYQTKDSCVRWCRSIGSSCQKWGTNDYGGNFCKFNC